MTPHLPIYGKLKAEGDRWILTDIPPHVAIKFKSVFPRVPKTQTKTFSLPLNQETCADLKWFESRYHMSMSGADRALLERGTRLFEEDRAAAQAIMLPDWKPPERHGFRPGRQAYHYQVQASELALRRKALLIGDDVGMGKEQPLTAKILTPSGWTTMGQIHVGAKVIGQTGDTRTVTAVHPQGVKPVYRVTFSDGAIVECGLEHQWIVRDQNRRLRGTGWVVRSLSFLLEQGIRFRNGASKWEIPLATAAAFEDRSPLPVDPYLLGALIGDGYLSGPSVAISVPDHKSEILERIKTIVGGEFVTGPHGGDCPQWRIVGDRPGRNNLKAALRLLGICIHSKERFIPERYFTAAPDQRLELLRGLMDTDGSAQKNRVVFHTCARRLAKDVADLVRSLGGCANIREYDRSHHGKPVEFQVNVRLPVCPFHLASKASQWRYRERAGRVCRYIRSVELVGEAEQQCISVSAKDGSYITDDYVVTHNTIAALHAIAGGPHVPAAVIVQPHLATQWVEEYIKPFTYMSSHIIRGTQPYSLPPANIYVFRYSNIHGWVDIAATGMFRTVIYDEIQELRNGTETAKGKAAEVFSQNAEIRIGLSATPVYNYGDEIFQVMSFIDPDVLGSWWDFVREWCESRGQRWMVKEPDALGSYLRESQVFIRRLRQGRPINRLPIEVAFDQEIADEAEDLARALAMKVLTGSFVERGNAARELDAFARLQTGLAKAAGVAAIARMYLEKGIPIILAGWHREVYDIWLDLLKDFSPRLYTGSESVSQKDKTKKAFISGETNLLIISLRSGAGLDGLQKRCNTVIFGELDWSPAVSEQLLGRVDRPGQPQPEITAIFPFVNYGSDPTLMRVNAIKKDQQRGIHDPGLALPKPHTDESHIKMLAKAFLEAK